ncbi:MAG: hypothetical protein JW914_05800 [Syntrophaceae bacterium]|nr:hypothetical protein [Syntrophaceae bacterium]
MEESIEMAVALQKNGYDTVYCTPHLIKGSYDADNKSVMASVNNLQKKLKEKNIQLKLIPGREYYMDEFLFDYLNNPMTLGETNYILVEIPNHIPRKYAKDACFRIKQKGFIPMIAHPERNKLFYISQRKKSLLESLLSLIFKDDGLKSKETTLLSYLKSIGCVFQANLGSFIGWYGERAQNTADSLKERNVYTHFGTDAHSLNAVNLLMNNGGRQEG